MTDFTCGPCGTLNAERASCGVCGTAGPTATPESLAATALADAAQTRAAQVEEAARGNCAVADHLGRVVDAHLDDALTHRPFGSV